MGIWRRIVVRVFSVWGAMCPIALLAFTVCVASVNAQCGHYDPSYSLKHGETVTRTLSYGSPVGEFTTALAGCKPANATWLGYGGVRTEIHFTYAEGSPANLPLITSASMHARDPHNITDEVSSYNITYEAQLPGLALPIRPRTFRASNHGRDHQPEFCVKEFSYDSQGRLVRIDSSGDPELCALRGPSTSGGNVSSVLLRSRAPRSGPGASAGYEKISYEDATHPLHATYYESDFAAVRVQWTTRKDGLVTDQLLQQFEDGNCSEPCWKGVCCQFVGDNSSGICRSVASCAQLNNHVHYKYDASDRLASMMDDSDGVFNFVYDGRGRIMNETYHGQGAWNYTYKNGHIQRFQCQVGLWDFGMPMGSGIQYV